MNIPIKTHRRQTLRIALALLLALSLSHCANLSQTPNVNPTWEQRIERMQALHTWEIRAKLAIRAPKNNGSASLNWQQRDLHYNIRLTGPFGSGKVIINGSPTKVTLTQAGKPPMIAGNAEALLYKATGWQLPFEQLTTWVRGIPDTTLPIEAMVLNDKTQLTQLEQAGWKITYSRYKVYKGYTLPSRIVATRDNLKLILAIHRWKIND